MGVNESEQTPGEPVIEPVRTLGNDITFGVDQQADMAACTGGGREILADGPGYRLEIPLVLMGLE